jgi:gamma-glutamyltranspeptidase / glutathione hydrolase
MTAPRQRVRTARGTHGVVATGHALATAAALDVLKGGGNAVDAAVAAALVLAVVTPYACSLGGDVYLLVADPRDGTLAGLNGTGRSPAAATKASFPDGIPAAGARSATTPGFVRGLADAHARFGRTPFGRLVEPAWSHASGGFPVHPAMAAATHEFAEMLACDPVASALFLPGGAPLAVGTPFLQPDLAAVLLAIAAKGADAFYAGSFADRMVRSARAAGGLLDTADFAAHASLWQEPIFAPFAGHNIVTMPPNSYGATLLFQLLVLEKAGIAAVAPGSARFVEIGYEARQRAYRLAAPMIVDPDDGDEHVRGLLFVAAGAGAPPPAGSQPPEARDRCTTCVVVIDSDGMAVSLIASVSAPYGAGIVLDGTGVLLNNRMTGFTPTGGRNGIGPSKRPASTLAPCLVFKDGALVMSVGTPGTVGQTCILAQFITRVLACGEEAAVAVEAPRWSVDFAGKLVVEDTFDPTVRATVGAAVKPSGWVGFGSIKAVSADGDGYAGVADFRRSATTDGW